MKKQHIQFKNKKYLLIDGAIATRKQFENGLASYAHLFINGTIRRYGKIIGDKKDIKKLKMVKVNPKVGVFKLLVNFLDSSDGWY